MNHGLQPRAITFNALTGIQTTKLFADNHLQNKERPMPLHDKDSVRDNLEDEVYASADLSVTLAVHLRGADADPLVHHRATRRAQDPWAPSLSQHRPGPRTAVSRRRALSSRFLSRLPPAIDSSGASGSLRLADATSARQRPLA